ncbi:hypothetical protein [Rhizobium sp. LCM 4573]|uniref:hypothetical protein n=1 Tax=Rhizobium sp. LCM 4573 TaxID=1848291 RepID=UPI0008D97823|nr:hypothetical protein [Rhizobium sp. LCM 4573]OHV76881.1 hypothetical protein LCM4573_08770 [Rhizobium sp. LCM 4573]
MRYLYLAYFQAIRSRDFQLRLPGQCIDGCVERVKSVGYICPMTTSGLQAFASVLVSTAVVCGLAFAVSAWMTDPAG